jgi:PKD repeat protein
MRFTALIVACLAAFITSCGGGAGSTLPSNNPPVVANPGAQPQTPQTPAPPASVGDAESVRSMPAPDGVDPTVWQVLTTRLADMLAASGTRGTSAAPVSDFAKVQVEVNGTTATFSWAYRLVGDYNQDGLVSGADLTAIGMYFGQANPGGGAFPVGSIQWVVDGDENGEINISDTTPIGVNWGRQVLQYNIYSSTDFGDYPLSAEGPNGPGAVLEGSVPFSAAVGDPRTQQLQFSLTVPRTELRRFYWLRPADGDSLGTPSNVISVGGLPENLPPIASFTAGVSTGTGPFQITFDASGSSDPDGLTGTGADIVQYEWDFNGDGLFDVATFSPVITRLYYLPGTYLVRLRVIDREAAFSVSTAQGVLIGPGPGNTPPVAALTALPMAGEAPLNVVFDASNSSDNGPQSSLNFQWDINLDGTMDLNTGNVPFTAQVFTMPGDYTVRVLVTDALGMTDTASVTVHITAAPNPGSPTVTFTAGNASGDAPLTVSFDFSGSTSAECPVAKYEIDYDGDGTYDQSWTVNPGTIEYTYTVGGNYTARLRVTTECGTAGEGTVDIAVGNGGQPNPGNQAPTAVLVLTKVSNHGPNLYRLDASGSTDADGSIVKYEWDFDGDGDYDEDTIGNAVVWHLYWRMDSFTPTVRVTDNDGATATASGGITTDWGWRKDGHGHGWWDCHDDNDDWNHGHGDDDDHHDGKHNDDGDDDDGDGDHDNGINGNDDDEGHDDDGHDHHDD